MTFDYKGIIWIFFNSKWQFYLLCRDFNYLRNLYVLLISTHRKMHNYHSHYWYSDADKTAVRGDWIWSSSQKCSTNPNFAGNRYRLSPVKATNIKKFGIDPNTIFFFRIWYDKKIVTLKIPNNTKQTSKGFLINHVIFHIYNSENVIIPLNLKKQANAIHCTMC